MGFSGLGGPTCRLSELSKMQHIGWNPFEWVEVENGRKALQYHMDIGIAAVTPLLLECLYEVQDVQSFESFESIFSQYRMIFEYPYTQLSNYSLYALGFCISTCSNTWSVTVRGMSCTRC